jgi:hypothetical protein
MFINGKDYELILQGDELELPDVVQRLKEGQPIIVRNITQRREFVVRHQLTRRQIEISACWRRAQHVFVLAFLRLLAETTLWRCPP